MVRRAAPRPRRRSAPRQRASPHCTAPAASRRSSSPTVRASPPTSSSSGWARLPNTEWLAGSGLQADPGLECDATLTAVGDPDILGAGDIVSWPHPLADGEAIRIEHWTVAAEQGQLAGRNVLLSPDERKPYDQPPYFWSDQYDVKIQSLGLPGRAGRLELLESTPDRSRLVYGGERDGRLVGVIAINAARRLGAYRMALADPPDFEDLRASRGRPEGARRPRADGMTWRRSDSTVDLLVFGGGMAGMSAAARAAADGASVVLVEKGPAIGGSAMYAGFVWTAPTVDVMREVNPDADPALSAPVVERYGEAMDWIRSLGVTVGEMVTVLGYGRGCATDMANYLLACERLVRERGELLVGASAQRLLFDDGAVVGAEIRTASGEQREIRARSTLLATGGFGGDPALRAEHIHPLAADLPLRANTHSVGDGLRLGLSVGAAFGPPDAGFYGHLIPSKVAYSDPYEFTDLTFYHSEHGVLLNLEGRRFCDETVGDHLSTLYVLEQPEARALLVYDQRVHDEWMMAPYVKGVEPLDKFQLAYRRGPGPRWRTRSRSSRCCRTSGDIRGPPLATRCSSSTGSAKPAPQPEPGARRDAAGRSAVLRDRGHPGDHLHLQRPADRSAGAGARRVRQRDPRVARRRGGCRRGVQPRVRRRPRLRPGLRSPGSRDGDGRARRLGVKPEMHGCARRWSARTCAW